MSLLGHLWDDTVAGPRPSGLNKLGRSSSSAPTAASGGGVPVTRPIAIVLPSGSPPDSGSEPSSPASAPDSPWTPTTPRGDWRRLRRKPAGPGPGAGAGAGAVQAEPWNPTVYNWVLISALDR